MPHKKAMLKFRYHFDLTPVEANRLAGWPKATWWRAETGKIMPPDNWEERLAVVSKRLDAAIAAKVYLCPRCRKRVKEWVDSGGTICPYCNRPFKRPIREKVRPLLKHPIAKGEDLDRKALEELGYTVDHKQKRKRRE